MQHHKYHPECVWLFINDHKHNNELKFQFSLVELTVSSSVSQLMTHNLSISSSPAHTTHLPPVSIHTELYSALKLVGTSIQSNFTVLTLSCANECTYMPSLLRHNLAQRPEYAQSSSLTMYPTGKAKDKKDTSTLAIHGKTTRKQRTVIKTDSALTARTLGRNCYCQILNGIGSHAITSLMVKCKLKPL